jgi:uncharacterized protein
MNQSTFQPINKSTMSITSVLLLILVGLAAGMLSSMVGIGGGIIVVPALVFFFGISQKAAQGTSLAMLLPPIGILGVLVYHKAGNIRWDYAIVLICAFIAGSYVGAKWVQTLNTLVIKRIFAVFMILMALKFLFDKPTGADTKADQNTEQKQ